MENVKIRLSVLLLAAVMMAACDDGTIQEKGYASTDGKNVRLEGVIEGCDAWDDGYTVNIAGFSENDDYATIAKVITPDATNGNRVSVLLSGIPEAVTSVRLCVLNRLRQHVATFAEVDITSASTRDTVRMDVGTVSAGPFAAIQAAYFNTTCVACHGATGRAAAGLFLTSDRSYDALVGVPSKKVEGQQLVVPGNAEASILYQALTTELTSTWREYHRDLVSEYFEINILPVLRRWIDGGAER